MSGVLGAYINQSKLCGPVGFKVWDHETQDFGSCFRNLFLILPVQVYLAVISAYYLGFNASQWYLRTSSQKWILLLRSFFVLLLALQPIGRSIFLYLLDRSSLMAEGEAGLLTGAIQCISWVLHLMYTYLLYNRISLSIRGPNVIISAWLLCLVVNIVLLRSIVLQSGSLGTSSDQVLLGTGIVATVCHVLYGLSLIPGGDQRPGHYEELSIQDRRESHEPLLGDSMTVSFRQRLATTYGGFQEDADPHYLGIAKDSEKVNWLSKLFFAWVNPLISKAIKGNIRSPDDLFDLPEKLTVHYSSQHFQKNWQALEKLVPVDAPPDVPRVKLLRLLYNSYGREFFAIGILRFINDCAGFAGPILLNVVVSFMETKSDTDNHSGYIAAVFLPVTALLAALSSCHFNLLMAELGVKVRAAISTAVYRKTVSVSSCHLGKFSTGEIVNFMSTDTDRIVNFSGSLHAAWSLPFQFGVTLILLYQQVGISFLTGLGFTLLVIPINKCIANKIGDLSTKMMQAKDDRVNLMSELLTGARVIKYFNWQRFFTQRVNTRRTEELKYLKGRKYLDALCVYLWATTPVLISVLTFVTFSLLGNTLTAARVFTSVALFAMLTGPLNAFPWVLNGLVEALVSLRRLETFFTLPDFCPDTYFSRRIYDLAKVEEEESVSIVLKDATFCHSAPHSTTTEASRPGHLFRLESLNLTVLQGDLVGVVGPVGAGKSSLLSGVLGELEKVSGEIAVARAGVGLVTQDPWLQAGSIRDNILFGTAYQHSWYSKVTDACALTEDFQQLARGDLTSVGEGGSALSGGQRARVALARAVYQNKDLYLIDDIFSAVDAPVASHIYRKCILGLLKTKSRILCTHHHRYLTGADKIICMEEGRIVDCGPASLLISRILAREKSTHPANTCSLLATPLETGQNTPYITEKEIEKEDISTVSQVDPGAGDVRAGGGEEEAESRETGAVRLRIYLHYIKAAGKLLSSSIVLSLIAMQLTRNLTDVWLAHWVGMEGHNGTQPNISRQNLIIDFRVWPEDQQSDGTGGGAGGETGPDPWWQLLAADSRDPAAPEFSVRYYLAVYATIAGANSFFSLLRAFLFAYGGVAAARTVHTRLLKSVMRAKTVFFDCTPLGRILNRFSSDLYTVDDSLPFILNIFLANLFGIVGPLVVCTYAMPWICLVLLPLGLIYFSIQRQYRPASRDLKRVGSVALSPIYAKFSETLSGLMTVRAGQQVPRFVREHEELLESSLKAGYAGQSASQWLELRLQLLGCGVLAGVALVAILQHQASETGADPGMVGLAISYALGITGKLSGLVSSFTETERELVAVERCVQYIEHVPQENYKGSLPSPYNWPSEGVVSLRNVRMRYRDHLPPALKGVTLQTRAGEKVGIVGRTGSGKSSVFHALFRLTEIEAGDVYIDNVNICRLDIEELREQLVIIPQTPFLFTGSVRENLDPIGYCTERQLMEALKRCRLDKLVSRLGGLEAQLQDRGRNLSAGQRQLLCLARAVISPARIVLVDEATANVDAETELHVQEVMQTCLADRTVLTIAHRVDAVLGCDRVFVMEGGCVVESGHPNLLLQDGGSRFSRFVYNK